MRHRVAGRKLGRTSEHRKALLRNLSTALFDKEKITTTLSKAKELRPYAEKLVTLSKRETLHARRQVLKEIQDRSVVSKLFDTLSARYAQRPGGYTRIVKLGPRRGDNAEMALIELVDSELTAEAPSGKSKRAKRDKAAEGAEAGAQADSGKASKTAKKKPAKGAAKPKRASKDAGKGGAKSAPSSRSTKKTVAQKTAGRKGGSKKGS